MAFRLSLTYAALALALTGPAGCTVVQTPRAELVGARVVDQTADGSRIELDLKLHNPNNVPLPLSRAQYSFSSPSTGTWLFADQAHRTLPARGEQTVTLALAVPSGEVDLQGADFTLMGRLQYVVPGEIRKIFTDSGLPHPFVVFWLDKTLD